MLKKIVIMTSRKLFHTKEVNYKKFYDFLYSTISRLLLILGHLFLYSRFRFLQLLCHYRQNVNKIFKINMIYHVFFFKLCVSKNTPFDITVLL